MKMISRVSGARVEGETRDTDGAIGTTCMLITDGTPKGLKVMIGQVLYCCVQDEKRSENAGLRDKQLG